MNSRKPTWSMDQLSDEEEQDNHYHHANSRNGTSNRRSTRMDVPRLVNQREGQDENDSHIDGDRMDLSGGDDDSIDQDRDHQMTLMQETSRSTSSQKKVNNKKGSSSKQAAGSTSRSTPANGSGTTSASKPSNRRASVSSNSSARPEDQAGSNGKADAGKKRKKKGGDGEEEVKRTRIANACMSCKQKKIKCDGEENCANCVHRKIDCVYSHNADKSAYSRRYVDSLEARIKRMEQAIQQSNSTVPPQTSSNPIETSRSIQIQHRSSSSAPTMVSFADEANDHPLDRSGMNSAAPSTPAVSTPGGDQVSSLVSRMGNTAGRLQMDENRSLRYLGPSASVTLFLDAHNSLGSQSASRALELAMLPPDANSEDLSWLHSSMGMNLSNVLPSAETVTFPPYDLAKMLVRIYFDQIHSVFPVLDQREFTLHYEQLYSSPRSSNADPTFLSILFAVFAVASRCCKDPRVCEDKEAEKFGYKSNSDSKSKGEEAAPNFALSGIHFFARAQVLSLHRATHTRLEQVQCMALLSYYMASSNCTARAWIMVGQALRIAIDLGFHRDLSHLNLSFFEISMRRHVFWNIYILDRLLSISLGRPLGIEDDNIDALLPQLEPQPPFPLLSGFASIVSLHRLTGTISRTANRLEQARHRGNQAEAARLRDQAHKHEIELNSWFEALPENLKSGQHEAGSPLATQSCIAFSCYQSATMVLYRSLLQDDIFTSGTSESDPAFLESKVFLAKCTRTSLMVIKAAPRIASSLPPSHYLLDYSQQLLVSGGFLALNAWKHSSSNAEHLLKEADEAVAGLRALETSFPGAKNLRRALVRLLRSLRTKLGMRKSGMNPPSASNPNRAGEHSLHRSRSQQSHSEAAQPGIFEASHSPEISRNSRLDGQTGASPYFGNLNGLPNFNAEGTTSGGNASVPSADASLDASLLALSNSNTDNWSGLDWLNGLLNDTTSVATPSQQQGTFSEPPVSYPTPATGNPTTVDFSAALWDDQMPSTLEEEAGDGATISKGKEKAKGENENVEV